MIKVHRDSTLLITIISILLSSGKMAGDLLKNKLVQILPFIFHMFQTHGMFPQLKAGKKRAPGRALQHAFGNAVTLETL